MPPETPRTITGADTAIHWAANIVILYFLHIPIALMFAALRMPSVSAAVMAFPPVPLGVTLFIYLLALPLVVIVTFVEIIGKLIRKERFTAGDWFRAIGLAIMAFFVISVIISFRNASW